MRARVRARRAFLDLFTDLYWRLLAVVVTPAWSVGNERLVDLKFYLRCLAKNVGDFPKNVGVFSEKRWRFFGKRGSFFVRSSERMGGRS